MASGFKQRKPVPYRASQNARFRVSEVEGVVSRYFSEDWNIASNNRGPMLSSLYERQTEAFALTGSDQAGRGSIDLFQKFVTYAFQPEQSLAELLVFAKFVSYFGNGAPHFHWEGFPPFTTDDHKIDVDPFLPQLVKRFNGL